ncbi:MAG: GGDEF domain-containing protein, partial [Gammaproteobacteria bacterium]|nr:GGDEF domain-containing protein [Gammaproteobacteria bacterium]
MPNPDKLQNDNITYVVYIIVSCILTAFLNTIHSYIIDIPVKSTSFLIPIVAGSIFGYLLAKNRILSQNLKMQAHTDMLTGAFNRMMFEQLLETEILKTNRYGGTFSVIFLDIDHFKQVNDQFGHLVGDMVLSDLAHLIKKTNRLSDVTARYGGEEFIILSISCRINDTVKHAERL